MGVPRRYRDYPDQWHEFTARLRLGQVFERAGDVGIVHLLHPLSEAEKKEVPDYRFWLRTALCGHQLHAFRPLPVSLDDVRRMRICKTCVRANKDPKHETVHKIEDGE